MTSPYDKACLCQTELQPSFPSNSHGLHGVLESPRPYISAHLGSCRAVSHAIREGAFPLSVPTLIRCLPPFFARLTLAGSRQKLGT